MFHKVKNLSPSDPIRELCRWHTLRLEDPQAKLIAPFNAARPSLQATRYSDMSILYRSVNRVLAFFGKGSFALEKVIETTRKALSYYEVTSLYATRDEKIKINQAVDYLNSKIDSFAKTPRWFRTVPKKIQKLEIL